VFLVGKAALQRNLGEALVASVQQNLHAPDAPTDDVLIWRNAKRVFEQANEIVGIEAAEPGHPVQPDIVMQFRFDKLAEQVDLPTRQLVRTTHLGGNGTAVIERNESVGHRLDERVYE
jgi:hypothetical protein